MLRFDKEKYLSLLFKFVLSERLSNSRVMLSIDAKNDGLLLMKIFHFYKYQKLKSIHNLISIFLFLFIYFGFWSRSSVKF